MNACESDHTAAGRVTGRGPAALVFDLGGVLVDLDQAGFEAAFRKLGVDPSRLQAFRGSSVNRAWNRGQLDEGGFLDALRRELKPGCTDPERLRTAWNSLLGAANAGMIRLAATSGRPLALLSNTDPWHWREVEQRGVLPPMLFNGLSFRLQALKPDERIYRRLLVACGWSASDCLLIDDSGENLEAAARLGFQTLPHAANGKDNEELRRCLELSN